MKEAVFCLLGTILFCVTAFAQRPPLGDIVTNPGIGGQGRRVKDEPLSVPQPTPNRAAQAAKVKQEAQTLAELAQTIPTGVDQAQKGVLPKDLLENLKRIEKLSRHLRRQLSP